MEVWSSLVFWLMGREVKWVYEVPRLLFLFGFRMGIMLASFCICLMHRVRKQKKLTEVQHHNQVKFETNKSPFLYDTLYASHNPSHR